MILLEMRNLLPECCQFVTFLSPLVAAQHGAPLSPGPSSWLWAQVWTRRDCFAAPVGHFTISFSLRNFKKPSRPHYLCTSFKATVAWLGSAKAAAESLLWRKQNMSPHGGLAPGTQGTGGLGVRLVWLNKHLFVCKHCAKSGGHRWVGGGLCLWRGFRGCVVVKHLPTIAEDSRDAGWIPGSERSAGGGNGNPLQYSCLENPTNRGASSVHGIANSWAQLSDWVQHRTAHALRTHSSVMVMEKQTNN